MKTTATEPANLPVPSADLATNMERIVHLLREARNSRSYKDPDYFDRKAGVFESLALEDDELARIAEQIAPTSAPWHRARACEMRAFAADARRRAEHLRQSA